MRKTCRRQPTARPRTCSFRSRFTNSLSSRFTCSVHRVWTRASAFLLSWFACRHANLAVAETGGCKLQGQSARVVRAQAKPSHGRADCPCRRAGGGPQASRKLRVKRRYNHTACRMMSGGNWWRANEIVVIRHHSRGSETRQSSRVNSPQTPLPQISTISHIQSRGEQLGITDSKTTTVAPSIFVVVPGKAQRQER